MSQFAPPHEPGNAPGDHQEILTPQAIEAVLADFRSWLQETAARGAYERPVSDATEQGVDTPRSPRPLDLHTLLGQFVALRHEVNLQTKASRAQLEQNAEALNSLEKALEELEEGRTAPNDGEVRLLLKTLVDLHDNLSLARREVLRTQETLTPLLDGLSTREPPSDGPEAPRSAAEPETASRRSWWARWFGKSSTQEAALRAWQDWSERSPGMRRSQESALRSLHGEAAALRRRIQNLDTWQAQARAAVQQVQRVVTSLITGYTMSQSRVERALKQFDLEAIPTVGLPFDPETMEVLEVVHEAGRATTEVIEEVRRGYLWRGQLFRCAQVRVARPAAHEPEA